MTPAKATLLAEAADYGSRHYRKQSAYEKGRLDITLFSWLRCKPTAVRLEVGLFGAGRVSGRASYRCDTTMIEDATRTTTRGVKQSVLRHVLRNSYTRYPSGTVPENSHHRRRP